MCRTNAFTYLVLHALNKAIRPSHCARRIRLLQLLHLNLTAYALHEIKTTLHSYADKNVDMKDAGPILAVCSSLRRLRGLQSSFASFSFSSASVTGNVLSQEKSSPNSELQASVSQACTCAM